MQRVLFHRSRDIKNKLLIIIHDDKMSVQMETTFLKQNLELLLQPFTLKSIKTESHLMTYFHQRQYRRTRASNHFSKKKTKELKEFKSKFFQTCIKTIFVFKMQNQDFKIHYK